MYVAGQQVSVDDTVPFAVDAGSPNHTIGMVEPGFEVLQARVMKLVTGKRHRVASLGRNWPRKAGRFLHSRIAAALGPLVHAYVARKHTDHLIRLIAPTQRPAKIH